MNLPCTKAANFGVFPFATALQLVVKAEDIRYVATRLTHGL